MGRNSGGNKSSGVPSVKGGTKSLGQAAKTLKTAIASGNKSAIDKATKSVDGVVSQMGQSEVRKHGMAFNNTQNKTEYTKAMESIFRKHAGHYVKTRGELAEVSGNIRMGGITPARQKRFVELVNSLNKKNARSFLDDLKQGNPKTQRGIDGQKAMIEIVQKRLKRKK